MQQIVNIGSWDLRLNFVANIAFWWNFQLNLENQANWVFSQIFGEILPNYFTGMIWPKTILRPRILTKIPIPLQVRLITLEQLEGSVFFSKRFSIKVPVLFRWTRKRCRLWIWLQNSRKLEYLAPSIDQTNCLSWPTPQTCHIAAQPSTPMAKFLKISTLAVNCTDRIWSKSWLILGFWSKYSLNSSKLGILVLTTSGNCSKKSSKLIGKDFSEILKKWKVLSYRYY